MRNLNRYIASSVLGSVFVVILVIVSLLAVSELVEQLEELKGGYGTREAMLYVVYKLPGMVYEYMPFSVLVGCLVGLGMLASSSELVVMRAAGVSVIQITLAVFKPVLMLIILNALLGDYVTPLTDQFADSNRAIAQGDSRALESRHGLWSKDGSEYMHFNAVQSNGRLYGVTRYKFDDQRRLVSSSFAETALYQGGFWREENVRVTNFHNDSTEVEAYAGREWVTKLSPDLLSVLVLEPEELSTRSLYSYSNYLGQQELDNKHYRLAFWKKVLQPLATLSLVLIAISFVFGPLREVTMGFRIFTGVIVGIVFQTSQDILGPSSVVYGFPPLVAVSLPIAICVVVGLVLLRRAK